ncbi:hypothetical protein EC988_000812 [Linderina pennispora]|nr:hypothetical protein EC988_000812 [Linderina pennispora]
MPRRHNRPLRSWTDSMGSSVTLFGNPSREPRTAMASGPHRPNPRIQPVELRRLVHDLNSSRIADIPEVDEDNLDTESIPESISPNGRQNRAASSAESSEYPSVDYSQSRRRWAVSRIKRKLRQLCHLCAYYFERMCAECATGCSIYSPLQYTYHY